MQEFFKVFFINFICDIDNLLILGTLLQKYSILNITVPAVITLTVSRTIYVYLVGWISELPMVHLLIGMLLLAVALKLVKSSIRGNEQYMRRPAKKIVLKARILLSIVATDFLICLDSVFVISQISKSIPLISFGIFSSLLISFLFLPSIILLARNFFWVNIIAGAFIAQNGVIGMLKDPLLAKWVNYFNMIFPEINVNNLFANSTIIIFVIIGLYLYIKHHRVTINK